MLLIGLIIGVILGMAWERLRTYKQLDKDYQPFRDLLEERNELFEKYYSIPHHYQIKREKIYAKIRELDKKIMEF